MIDDGGAGQRTARRRGVGKIGLDDVDPGGQAGRAMPGYRSHGQSPRHQLTDHRTADCTEPGDNVQFGSWWCPFQLATGFPRQMSTMFT